ncbi:Hypothetical predicted protein, partial [Olea europaea subsp. europaea]
MVPLKQTKKSTHQWTESFFTLTNDENEITESIREFDCFYPVVVKGLFITNKEDESVPPEGPTLSPHVFSTSEIGLRLRSGLYDE